MSLRRFWRHITGDAVGLYMFGGLLLTGSATVGWDRRRRRDQNDGKRFSSYKLISKEAVSQTSSIFTLRPLLPPKNPDDQLPLWRSLVWSVELKQPLLQIARPYTPLPPRTADEARSGYLRFLIRKEYEGEVSGYLHALSVNASGRASNVEVRGPHVELVIPQDVEQILFIAGGTGIVPAMQVAASFATSLADSEVRRPTMQILWANRHREECAGVGNSRNSNPNKIVQELSRIRQLYDQKEVSKLVIRCFVDEENSFITARDIQSFTNLQSILGDECSGRNLILISGPDGFVEYLAGPKSFQSRPPKGGSDPVLAQSPVGGLLGRINLEDWEVVKL